MQVGPWETARLEPRPQNEAAKALRVVPAAAVAGPNPEHCLKSLTASLKWVAAVAPILARWVAAVAAMLAQQTPQPAAAAAQMAAKEANRAQEAAEEPVTAVATAAAAVRTARSRQQRPCAAAAPCCRFPDRRLRERRRQLQLSIAASLPFCAHSLPSRLRLWQHPQPPPPAAQPPPPPPPQQPQLRTGEAQVGRGRLGTLAARLPLPPPPWA